MAVPAEPTDRTPELIKGELATVSDRVKANRKKLSRDGGSIPSGGWNALVNSISEDVRLRDALLDELEDALTWQNPERLAKK
jgi:hypothetical protein